MKESLFGDVPDGSPLSYQLQDYHTMAYQFEAYLPLPIINQNGNSTTMFPNLPTRIGESFLANGRCFLKRYLEFVEILTLNIEYAEM